MDNEDASDLITRIEKEGVALRRVTDGVVFMFSAGVLRRLLEDAEASPAKKAIVFVRTAPQESGV